MTFRLKINGVEVVRDPQGVWCVAGHSLPVVPCDSFRKALARALLDASSVEWPDDVEDEILDAVRVLTTPPKSQTNIIEIDKDHPLAQPLEPVPVLPHVPGQMLQPEEKTLKSFRSEDLERRKTITVPEGGMVGIIRVNMGDELRSDYDWDNPQYDPETNSFKDEV